jgi:tetratricopeptide (TPR) repeat protein
LHEGRIPAAQDYFHKSLQLYQTVLPKPNADVADIMTKLSMTLTWSDDFTNAEQTARQAIAIFASTVSPLHPDRVAAELTLAQALYLQGRLEESASMLEAALTKSMLTFGPQSVQVVDALDSLAVVKYAEGKLSEAEKYSRSGLAKARNSYGAKHPATANTATALGRTLYRLGKYREAEITLREALQIFCDTLPPDHQYVASTEYFLGEVLLATNRVAEAEAVLTASMNRWKRGDAPAWRAMRSANALGEALYRQGRTAEGEKYLSESLRELSSDPKADLEAKDKAKARAKRYLRTTLALH